MPWIQLRLNATSENAEAIGDELVESGAVSVTFQDSHDTPILSHYREKLASGVIPMLLAYMMQKPI